MTQRKRMTLTVGTLQHIVRCSRLANAFVLKLIECILAMHLLCKKINELIMKGITLNINDKDG